MSEFFDWAGWVINDEQWITEGDGFFENEKLFSIEADIVFNTKSRIQEVKEFTSQADITSNITSDLSRFYSFSTTSNIIWDIPAISFNIGIEFTIQSDIIFNIPSIDHNVEVHFLTQPFINFTTDSTIFALKSFSSQADIVWDATSDIDQGGIFSVTAGVGTNIRSDIKTENCFIILPSIVSNISDPEIQVARDFSSNADIIWNTVSNMGGNRNFSIQSDIAWDIETDIKRANILSSQSDIGFDLTSDIGMGRRFAVQADIVWDNISNIFQERLFVIGPDIVSNIDSDIRTERQFLSTSDIVWDTLSDIRTERQFLSTSDNIFDLSSDANARRSFAAGPDIIFDIPSHLAQDIPFTSHADVTWDTLSDIRTERRFATISDIIWATSDPIIRRFFSFHVEPDISFLIPGNPINIFKENLFNCLPDIIFDLTSVINIERRFTAQSDITWNIGLTEIYNTRNFASTVNIVINIESLNILTMTLDDLFPNTMRSLTQKLTARIVN